MKKISLVLFAILGIGLLFTSCSKDKTITNEVNNAFSANSDINPSDWQISSDQRSATFTLDVGDNLTQDNFNQEGVLAYIAQVDGKGNIGEYTQIPRNNWDNYNFTVSHALNEVYIDIKPVSGGQIIRPSNTYYLKLLFIDAAALNQSNINTSDYNAVKAAFHLK